LRALLTDSTVASSMLATPAARRPENIAQNQRGDLAGQQHL
jgi:hypothetical protein